MFSCQGAVREYLSPSLYIPKKTVSGNHFFSFLKNIFSNHTKCNFFASSPSYVKYQSAVHMLVQKAPDRTVHLSTDGLNPPNFLTLWTIFQMCYLLSGQCSSPLHWEQLLPSNFQYVYDLLQIVPTTVHYPPTVFILHTAPVCPFANMPQTLRPKPLHPVRIR